MGPSNCSDPPHLPWLSPRYFRRSVMLVMSNLACIQHKDERHRADYEHDHRASRRTKMVNACTNGPYAEPIPDLERNHICKTNIRREAKCHEYECDSNGGNKRCTQDVHLGPECPEAPNQGTNDKRACTQNSELDQKPYCSGVHGFSLEGGLKRAELDSNPYSVFVNFNVAQYL